MDRKKGILFAAVGAIIWSTGGVFIKLVDAPGIYIAAARSLVAGLVFIPFIKFKKIIFTKNLLFLLLCYAYTLIGFVMANKLTTAANAIILQYTAPVWLFIFYSIKNKNFDPRKLLPVGLVTAGIIIFLFEPKTGTNIIGNLLALSTGITFAGVAHFSAMNHGTSGPGLISICNLTTFILAVPFVKGIREITLGFGTSDIIGILFLGAFQIAVGYVFYIKSLKHISPLDTSLICLLEPLMNPIWVLIFIAEVPTFYAIAGSVFVIAGIISNIINERSKLPQKFQYINK